MLVWLAVAAGVVLAALVGIATALGATEFDDRHARILGSALVALAGGGAALAGLRTAEEEPRRPLGWVVLALALGAVAVLLVGIWWESGWVRHAEQLGRVVLSAIAVLLAALVVGALRRSLELALRPVRVGFWAVSAVVGLTAVFAFAAIWTPSVDEVGRQTADVDRIERVLVALLVAIVAGFLVLPLLERALVALREHRQRVDRRTA